MTQRMTVAQVAKAMGVHANSVYAWRRSGCPYHPDGTMELEAVQSWRAKGEVSDRAGGGNGASDDDGGVVDWQTEYRKLKALQERVHLDNLQSSVVDREHVRRWLTAIGTEVKKHLLAMSRRLSPQLAGLPAREIQVILDEDAQTLLRRISAIGQSEADLRKTSGHQRNKGRRQKR
jgi:phage terminase Nu1 subunit (DNA packaging protein)